VQRWFALVAALLSTAIFVVVRNALDLEDSRFMLALLACSALALTLTVASAALLRRMTLSALALGVAAFILVPILFVAYIVLFVVSVCLVGGQSCYS
jgi:hypothetical protein